MVSKKSVNGAMQLKKDLQNNTIQTCYVIAGEESYLKEYYLEQLKKKLLDTTMRDFNYDQFEGKQLTAEQLIGAVESPPAMAERRVVVVKDLDIYKPGAHLSDTLQQVVADLPPYTCLIFYYDLFEWKQDKRLKIHALLEKNACIALFDSLEERELNSWVRRRFKALGKEIDHETTAKLLFFCGHSMTNLVTEIEKVAAFSSLDWIKEYHIETVCNKVLDAVIFDMTDAIGSGRFSTAISIFRDLIAQKNDEIQIFSAIIRHFQRLYIARLSEQARGGEQQLMELLGTRSSFYAKKLFKMSRKLPTNWLRQSLIKASETDALLKSSTTDRQQLVEMTLLQMAVALEGIA